MVSADLEVDTSTPGFGGHDVSGLQQSHRRQITGRHTCASSSFRRDIGRMRPREHPYPFHHGYIGASHGYDESGPPAFREVRDHWR